MLSQNIAVITESLRLTETPQSSVHSFHPFYHLNHKRQENRNDTITGMICVRQTIGAAF